MNRRILGMNPRQYKGFVRNWKRKVDTRARRQWDGRPNASHPMPLWLSADLDGEKYRRRQLNRRKRKT